MLTSPCVLLPPLAHQFGNRPQRLAVRSQRVFHLWRDFGVNLAVDDPVPFELAKLLGQHPLADTGNFAAQFGEPPDGVFQPEEDDGLPFAADHVQRDLDRAIEFLLCCNLGHDTYRKISKALYFQYLATTGSDRILP